MEELFYKKCFLWMANLLEQTYGGSFYMRGLLITLCKGRGSFTNTFSSNLNTRNPNVFLKHGRIGFILEINS